jgi:hypothetical protein
VAPEGEYESRDSFRALNENEIVEIQTGLRDWAESHPSGKEPIFFEMGRSLTAIDFAIEVAERTDIGRFSPIEVSDAHQCPDLGNKV